MSKVTTPTGRRIKIEMPKKFLKLTSLLSTITTKTTRIYNNNYL
jgi:hypothetical protein